MGIESRAGVRVKMDANVKVEIDMAMKENVRILREPKKAEILDLSVIGLGLLAPIYFPKGAELIINVDASVFKMDKPAKIIGEVRYCQPTKEGKYRLGIKFTEIDKPLLAKITEYIEQNKNKAA